MTTTPQGTGGEFRFPHSPSAVLQQLRLSLGDEQQRAVGDTTALLDDRDRWVEDNFARLGLGGGAGGGRVPSGAIMDFAGPIAPEGWFLCDGSYLERADFPALFDAIGVAWGTTTGTNFRLPDFRGRTAIGAGAGASLTPRTAGQYGGEEAHALTANENGAHTHNYNNAAGSTVGALYNASGMSFYGNSFGQATSPSGSGAAHNNMQPFAVVTKIIKG